MAILTVTMRNKLVDAYKAAATYMAVFSTTPTSTGGTELSGGSPAYARKASNWGATANSAATAAPTAFDLPSGGVAAGVGFYDAVTAGNFLDGVGITSQTFASQGTLTVTATFTEA